MDHSEPSLDFSKSLLYSLNNEFIEGNISEPQNAQEIRVNLASRLGTSHSTLSLWRVKALAFVLFVINCIFALVVLFGFMRVFKIESLNTVLAGIVALCGYSVGWLITSQVSKLLFGSLPTISNPSPVKPEAAYKALIEKSEIVNGSIIDVVSLLGDVLITYTVKTPKHTPIQRTYKTALTDFTRADIGKEVVVLYFNETINALL
jgi:hypothetical protein